MLMMKVNRLLIIPLKLDLKHLFKMFYCVPSLDHYMERNVFI